MYRENQLSNLKRIQFEFFRANHFLTDGPVVSLEMNDALIPFADTREFTIDWKFEQNAYLNPSSGLGFSIPDSTQTKSVSAVREYFAVLNKDNELALGQIGNTPATVIPTHTSTTTGPLLLDIDRDDTYETAITAGRELRIYEPDGTFEAARLPDDPAGDPAAADIDRDGYPEIILCTAKQVFAFRAHAAVATRFPFDLPPGDESEVITSPPVVADLDNDGRLDIAFATSTQRMIALGPDGFLADGFPLALAGEVTTSPCLFRLDGSGSLGLAYITTDGRVMAHDLGARADDALMPWPMWRGGPELSGAFLNEKITTPVKTTAPFETFCYPNPVTGPTATFRVVPECETGVTITVYTIDGRKVFATRRDKLTPGVVNDIPMDASELASGLYIARIETKQKTVTCKIGVLK